MKINLGGSEDCSRDLNYIQQEVYKKNKKSTHIFLFKEIQGEEMWSPWIIVITDCLVQTFIDQTGVVAVFVGHGPLIPAMHIDVVTQYKQAKRIKECNLFWLRKHVTSDYITCSNAWLIRHYPQIPPL